MLKLKEEKTDVLIIHSPRQDISDSVDRPTPTLKVGDACVSPSKTVRNLGACYLQCSHEYGIPCEMCVQISKFSPV